MLRSVVNTLRTRGPCVRAWLAPAVPLVPCQPERRALSTNLLAGQPCLPTSVQLLQHRHIWGWLNSIFNKVDADRINDVGPDRACAEWLLRCGAHFRWRSQHGWQKDYNALAPTGGKNKKYIEEINADNAALMDIGFQHFKGLSSVRKIRFHYCGYLEDPALTYLGYLSHCLESLEISSCGNITTAGLRHLGTLTSCVCTTCLRSPTGTPACGSCSCCCPTVTSRSRRRRNAAASRTRVRLRRRRPRARGKVW